MVVIIDGNVYNMLLTLDGFDDVFHLTGSRYFGTETEESDYDLMVEYSPRLLNILLGIGFGEMSSHHEYRDFSIATIVEYQNIDIQLINPGSFSAKLEAQYIFKNLNILRPSCCQWNFLINYLKCILNAA